MGLGYKPLLTGSGIGAYNSFDWLPLNFFLSSFSPSFPTYFFPSLPFPSLFLSFLSSILCFLPDSEQLPPASPGHHPAWHTLCQFSKPGPALCDPVSPLVIILFFLCQQMECANLCPFNLPAHDHSSSWQRPGPAWREAGSLGSYMPYRTPSPDIRLPT